MNEQNSTTIQNAQPAQNSALLALIREERKVQEAALRLRYPDVNIIPDSLSHHNAGLYQGKRVVRVVCACGITCDRATSDLHTWRGCPSCLKHVRRLNKATNKLGLAQLQAKIEALEAENARLAAQPAPTGDADATA